MAYRECLRELTLNELVQEAELTLLGFYNTPVTSLREGDYERLDWLEGEFIQRGFAGIYEELCRRALEDSITIPQRKEQTHVLFNAIFPWVFLLVIALVLAAFILK